MAYDIKRIKGGETVAIETTDLSFEAIKQDAMNWVEQDLADRVEVRDANGQLVHHYPRVMHVAKG